ncbi:MAG: hypothetical protein OEV95_11535 [Gemmatimonadota bacterium]|nr:hypothetical protein [Gemmatimonadota bacterium]MDH5284465.1 hypothetical protein [Gemmatimonadota bacterium]
MNARIGACLAIMALSGCARAMAQDPAGTGGELPPPGYGSLTRDYIAVQVTLGDVSMRFVPLDERLLRLTAPDAYQSLHGLVAARQGQIDSAAQAAGVNTPGVAMVTFFALRQEAPFDPDNVTFSHRNQIYRPVAILPLTGNFTSRRLDVRQQASAIYLFDHPIPVFEPFAVLYETSVSEGWNEILRRVDRERVRVQSRWQSDRGKDSTTAAAKPDSATPN